MLDKQKTYLVLNYDTSPVSIKTRYQNELVPAGNDTTPSTLPLSIDDITYINSTTKVFKIGRLWFEPEFEKDIYAELRIRDWKDIMTNQDIYDAILNPTMEKLERILDIDDQMYFSRIYGAYIGLKNSGVNISTNVESVIKARYAEFLKHKRKTEIQLRPKEVTSAQSNEVVEDLQKQLAETRAMLEKLLASQNATAEPAAKQEVKEPPKPKASTTTRKKSTSSTKSSTPEKE